MVKVKKGFSKFIGLLVAFSMVIASGTYNVVSAAPVVLTDIAGHWAAAAIQSAVDNGYISGYGDGRFGPEDPITRGQLASMVNRAFDLSKKASLSFTDMKDAKQWYYEPVQVAVGSGYMVGYENNTFRPLTNITWAQCITVYVNLLGYSENRTAAQNISNYSTFQNKWYVGNIGAAYATGILDSKVLLNGAINPDSYLTRAEAAYMLSIAYSLKNGSGTPAPTTVTELADKFVVPANATFGPTSGVQTITKNVSVTGSGAVLQNLDIRGNLTIEASVGNGNVSLKGVTVTGTTTILGGGPNTIRAVDTQFSSVTINDADNNVRLLLEGNSRATTVNVNSGATLTATGLTGTGFGTVNVTGSTSSNYPLNINANITSLNITSYGSYINVNGGIVNSANLAATATGSTLNLTSTATISSLVANASSTVNGRVNQATLNTTGVYMPQAPTSLTAGSLSPSTTPNTTTSLTLSPSSLTLNSTNTSGVTLTATIGSSAVASGQSVVFTSSDSSFVTLSSGSYTGQSVSVTPSGNVAYVTARLAANSALVAANIGKTVTITASYGGYTQTSYVTIGSTTGSLISLSPGSITFNSGNSGGVSLSATLNSSIVASGQSVTFTSSDSSLVTLSGGSGNGQTVSVTPSGTTATITARLTSTASLTTHNGRSVTITAYYGGYSQSMTAYINTVSGNSALSASPSSVTLSENNLSGVNLTANTNSVISSTTPMTFRVNDSSLATVTSGTTTGQSVTVTPTGTSTTVTVKPVGTAAQIIANRGRTTTLTITYGTYTQTVPITISNTVQIADVTLSASTNSITLNNNVTITPTYINSDGTKSSSYSGTVYWTAAGNALVSVGNGVYRGAGTGTGKAVISVVTGNKVISAEYIVNVNDPGRTNLRTAPSAISVNRITDVNGYNFNIELLAGKHSLRFEYDVDAYDLYYYTTPNGTALQRIESGKTLHEIVTTGTGSYGSTTLKMRVVPNNSHIQRNGSIRLTGDSTYTTIATLPITTRYNERAINVTLTPSPVLSVDKTTINTKDSVLNVTITDPAAQGNLIVRAYGSETGNDLKNDAVIFGNSTNTSSFTSIPVTATAGTAITVPVQIKHVNDSYLSVEYSSSANISAKLMKPGITDEELRVTLKPDGTATESPTLDYVLINNISVPISSPLTVISDALYLNQSAGTAGTLIGNNFDIVSPSPYLFVNTTGVWDADTASNKGAFSQDIKGLLEGQSTNTRSIYIWTSSSDTATATDEPTNRYQIMFTNFVTPGISGASILTTNNAMFSGNTVANYSSPVYDAIESSKEIGYLSYNYNQNSNTLDVAVIPTMSSRKYDEVRIGFNGTVGTAFSIISSTASVGMDGSTLKIPANLLNSTTEINNITIKPNYASAKFQALATSSDQITLNIKKYSTVAITSTNAILTNSGSTGYYSTSTSGGARSFSYPADTTSNVAVNITALPAANSTYSTITLSLADFAATTYTISDTSSPLVSVNNSGTITIPATTFSGDNAYVSFNVTSSNGKTYTVTVTK